MKSVRRVWGFLSVFLLGTAAAEELRGKVVSAADAQVVIRLDGEARPRAGDAVRIGFEVPGVGFVPLEGVWSVSLVDQEGQVVAKVLAPVHGKPQAGHLALIETRGEGVSAPSPSLPQTGTAIVSGRMPPPDQYRPPDQGAMDPPQRDPRGREAGELYALGHQRLWGSQDPAGFAGGVAQLRRAADLGHLEAVYEVGVAYSQGKGVAQDYAEAARWFEKAAAQGHPSGQYNIGLMYRQGLGVRQSDPAALGWLRQAAQGGIARAHAQVGMIYIEERGVPRDDAQALAWFRKGAEAGDATAANNLGTMYRDGRGTPADFQQALFWYQMAFDQGNFTAAFNLGYLHEKGWGVPRDIGRAIEWYRRAAASGVRDAAVRLEALQVKE